eukprot:TRINITY_DN51478_c0_g1_i1.p1 TRINITY_DN51478_c0_g1~~TRINITY_DN51478_c0_g1_i1.p1  ORF type:complete len:2153 (+),score=526.00 TRINITY_DN51478_c0_g1_i1:192-6650(+)
MRSGYAGHNKDTSLICLVFASLLLLRARLAAATCYKHSSCETCIAEVFQGGSCLWYQAPGREAHGSCVAGLVGSADDAEESTSVAADVPPTESKAVWTMAMPDGRMSKFIVHDIDMLSEGSCYVTPQCEFMGQCEPGFYPVQNKPCYLNQYPEWRTLKCCRQQRNADGYLVGFDAKNGRVQGELFYATCCATCFPGQVNSGCNAYEPGSCERCPVGSFNALSLPGSICLDCQPCPAGRQRADCGPSSPGRCEECPAGRFKAAGLEGNYQDQCLPCDSCQRGLIRTGCGPVEEGSCTRCPMGEWFAQPRCKACEVCDEESPRFGCGGTQTGVCSPCPHGWRVDTDARSVRCTQCDECPDGFTRLGCGGAAAGECVRLLNITLEGAAANCPSASGAAFCSGVSLSASWSMDIASSNVSVAAGLLMSGMGDCTAEAGICLVGVWKATLWRRAPKGTRAAEVQVLGEWWPSDLEIAMTGAVMTAKADFNALEETLEDAAGYFVRISIVDYGGSCCAESTNLKADTVDFAVRMRGFAAARDVQAAEQQLLADNRQAALELLDKTCHDNSWAVDAGQPHWAVTTACERSKSLRLGAPIGEKAAFTPPLLYRSTERPAVNRQDALDSARRAKSAVEEWERLGNGISSVPGDAVAWSALVAGIQAGSAAEQVQQLLRLANETALAAEALIEAAATDVSPAILGLRRTLIDMKELDLVLASEVKEVGFNLIRMAQSIIEELWQDLADAPKLADRPAWFSKAFHTIGNSAVMLLGSWDMTWKHTVQWEISAEVGEQTSDTWPPEGDDEFGGAPRLSSAVPLESSRQRLWLPFREVADAWLARWRRDAAAVPRTPRRRMADDERERGGAGSGGGAGNTTEGQAAEASEGLLDWAQQGGEATAEQISREVTANQSVLEMAGTVDFLATFIPFVESLTENFLEPLTRPGSRLLRGALPNVTACDASHGPFLSAALRAFPEAGAIDDAWHGLGSRSIRPWVELTQENFRLRQAGSEVVALVRGRALLFETLTMQIVDLRELLFGPVAAAAAATVARSAVKHVEALLQTSAASLEAEPYRWKEMREALDTALSIGSVEAARLARRRLHVVERLAFWIGRSTEGAEENADWIWQHGEAEWRLEWPPGGTAAQLQVSLESAKDELDRALMQIAQETVKPRKAYLRMEFDEMVRPMAFAGLRKTGQLAFRLKAPRGPLGVHMHGEVHTVLMSPTLDWKPLLPCEEDCAPVAGFAKEPIHNNTIGEHIEVQLRHVASSSGGAPHTLFAYTTRHVRGNCRPYTYLGGERADAALAAMDGIWMLSVRDGLTGKLLEIDPGTSIRIMFSVNVPEGLPPFKILREHTDNQLYTLPESGDCHDLSTITGEKVIYTTTSTTTPEFRTQTWTTRTTTSRLYVPQDGAGKIVTVDGTDTTETTTLQAPSFLGQTKEGKDKSNVSKWLEENLLTWLIPIICVGVVVVCTVYFMCYFCWKRRRLRNEVKELEEADERPDGNTSPRSLDSEGLRLRSPKQPPEAPTLTGAGLNPAWCAPSTYKPFRPSQEGKGDVEEWKTDVTPRRELQKGDDSSSSGSDSESGSDDDWDQAATPEASTPRSQSSGSSTSSSEGPDDGGADRRRDAGVAAAESRAACSAAPHADEAPVPADNASTQASSSPGHQRHSPAGSLNLESSLKEAAAADAPAAAPAVQEEPQALGGGQTQAPAEIDSAAAAGEPAEEPDDVATAASAAADVAAAASASATSSESGSEAATSPRKDPAAAEPEPAEALTAAERCSDAAAGPAESHPDAAAAAEASESAAGPAKRHQDAAAEAEAEASALATALLQDEEPSPAEAAAGSEGVAATPAVSEGDAAAPASSSTEDDALAAAAPVRVRGPLTAAVAGAFGQSAAPSEAAAAEQEDQSASIPAQAESLQSRVVPRRLPPMPGGSSASPAAELPSLPRGLERQSSSLSNDKQRPTGPDEPWDSDEEVPAAKNQAAPAVPEGPCSMASQGGDAYDSDEDRRCKAAASVTSPEPAKKPTAEVPEGPYNPAEQTADAFDSDDEKERPEPVPEGPCDMKEQQGGAFDSSDEEEEKNAAAGGSAAAPPSRQEIQVPPPPPRLRHDAAPAPPSAPPPMHHVAQAAAQEAPPDSARSSSSYGSGFEDGDDGAEKRQDLLE